MNNIEVDCPNGFVRAEFYGVLPEKDGYIGLCFLNQNNEKNRFLVKKEEVQKMLKGVLAVDSATQYKSELDQLTTFWEVTALEAKRNLLIIQNLLELEPRTQNELLAEVKRLSARSQELLEVIRKKSMKHQTATTGTSEPNIG